MVLMRMSSFPRSAGVAVGLMGAGVIDQTLWRSAGGVTSMAVGGGTTDDQEDVDGAVAVDAEHAPHCLNPNTWQSLKDVSLV